LGNKHQTYYVDNLTIFFFIWGRLCILRGHLLCKVASDLSWNTYYCIELSWSLKWSELICSPTLICFVDVKSQLFGCVSRVISKTILSFETFGVPPDKSFWPRTLYTWPTKINPEIQYNRPRERKSGRNSIKRH